MFFHHPLYSSGDTHGPAELQRDLLEPVFLKHGVNVVLSGHEHFYERLKPQKGIQYFIVGSSAKIRVGDLNRSELTAKGWDTGYGFMLVEIAGDDLFFQVISDKGEIDRRGQRPSRRQDRADAGTQLPARPAGPGGAQAARHRAEAAGGKVAGEDRNRFLNSPPSAGK